MEKTKFNIDKTDEDFSNFCNIVISRATMCWQSGLEDYPFGEKIYSKWQSKNTILQIFSLEKNTGSYDRNYVLYIKESICLYYTIWSRERKLLRILKKNKLCF